MSKWTNATLTADGQNLQAQLLDGGGFEFTKVTAADSSGTDKLTLTMQPSVIDGKTITVPVLLSNSNLSAGFTMNQLKFYARKTGIPAGDEIVYAIAEDETGDEIPSESDSPGFTIDWSYTFQFGNATSVNVSIDPAGLVSMALLGTPGGIATLNNAGAVPIEQGGTGAVTASAALAALGGMRASATGDDIPTSASDSTSISSQLSNLNTLVGGATTPQAALAALGAGVRPNLLDNAIFIGGGSQQGGGQLPINQHGETEYNNTTFGIDRWTTLGRCTIQSDCIVIVKSGGSVEYFFQVIPTEVIDILLGQPVTYSVAYKDENGRLNISTISFIFPASKGKLDGNAIGVSGITSNIYSASGSVYVCRFYSGSIIQAKLVAVKLEFGSNQTLAYQDEDGAWQLLPQPESDYATQLAKCQRYFRSFNAWTKFEADYIDANQVYFSIPGDMRIDPTVTGEWGVYTGFTLQNGFVLEGHRTGSNLVVVASKESHGLTTAWLGVKDNSFGYLNADL